MTRAPRATSALDTSQAPALGPSARPDGGRTIFINYRREDSGGQARALLYALEQAFPQQVFVDVKGIAPGHHYLDEIAKMVASCRAVLVLIGKGWLDARDPSGRRRLEDPQDVVSREIASALERPDVLVIPVLVGGAALPAEESLPEAIRDLVRRQCINLTDQDWDYDVSRLVETLGRTVNLPGGASRAPRRALYAAAAGVAAIALAAGAIVVWRGRARAPAPPPQLAAAPAPPPVAAAPPPAAAPSSQPSPLPSPIALPVPATAPPPDGAATPRKAEAQKPAAKSLRGPARAERQKVASKTGSGSRGPAAAGGSGFTLPTPPTSALPDTSSLFRAEPPGPAPAPPGSSAPARHQVLVSKEVLSFQQYFGDPALRERGRRLVEPARWVLDESSLTLSPQEPMPGFFPITLQATRAGDRVSFDGTRTGRAGGGNAYVHVSGQLTTGEGAVATVEIEIGRAAADGADLEPTYKARARVRLRSE